MRLMSMNNDGALRETTKATIELSMVEIFCIDRALSQEIASLHDKEAIKELCLHWRTLRDFVCHGHLSKATMQMIKGDNANE